MKNPPKSKDFGGFSHYLLWVFTWKEAHSVSLLVAGELSQQPTLI